MCANSALPACFIYCRHSFAGALFLALFCLLHVRKQQGMPKTGPIIIIEDDLDDQELMKEVCQELRVPNILRFFNSCIAALEYLLATAEKPFLIISDINVPAMSGLEFLKSINENCRLKSKGIPFVFLSTSSDNSLIAQAYQMSAHGFFVKPPSVVELKEMVQMIIGYWKMSGRALT